MTTTIISRLYETPERAASVSSDLREAEFMDKEMDVISGDNADAAETAMLAASVHPSAAKAYADHVAKGATLVVVRATIGRANKGRRILDSQESMDVGAIKDEIFDRGSDNMSTYRRQEFDNLMPRGSLMLTDPDFALRTGKRYGAFLVPLLTKRKPSKTALRSGKHYGAFLVPLLTKRKPKNISLRTGKRYGAFLFPLLLKS